MIQAISAAQPATKTVSTKNVTKPLSYTADRIKKDNRSIDEKQHDNLVLELDYIGKSLKAILDVKAGKNVDVKKQANKLEDDDVKTPAQKQKDDVIVELGFIGDVLKNLADVNAGKEVKEVAKFSNKASDR